MHLDTFHGYAVGDHGHHHHLLCHQCGRVTMVDASGVEAEIQKLAQQLEFRMNTYTLEFSGVSDVPGRRELGPVARVKPAAAPGRVGLPGSKLGFR
jgi:hypothetical protein